MLDRINSGKFVCSISYVTLDKNKYTYYVQENSTLVATSDL